MSRLWGWFRNLFKITWLGNWIDSHRYVKPRPEDYTMSDVMLGYDALEDKSRLLFLRSHATSWRDTNTEPTLRRLKQLLLASLLFSTVSIPITSDMAIFYGTFFINGWGDQKQGQYCKQLLLISIKCSKYQ